MRISTITKVLAQYLFWAVAICFFAWFFKQEDKAIMLCLAMLMTFALCYVARTPYMLYISTVLHILSGGIPAIFYIVGKIGMPALIFIILYIVLSLIARIRKAEFMDRAHTFQQVVIVILYLVGCIVEYDHMLVMYGGLFGFTFLFFLQNILERNEAYIDNVSAGSDSNNRKMINSSDVMSIIAVLGMMIICLLFSLLGKVGPFAFISGKIGSKTRNALDFIKRVAMMRPSATSEQVTIPDGGGLEMETPAPVDMPDTGFDKFLGFVGAMTAILVVLFVIVFGAIDLYRQIKKKKNRPEFEQEISISARKEKKPKKVNPRKTDPSYSNRKSARKIYKKKIRGKNQGQRQDLDTRTPVEQAVKVSDQGIILEEEFVDIYEKARYSKEKVSKEDIKKMQNM